MRFENQDEREHYLTQLTRLTKDIEAEHPKEIIVPDNLIKPDELIKEVRTDLRSKKPSSWRNIKTVINSSQEQISISVTKENVTRALRFMNAFIKLVRTRGHEIKIKDENTLLIVDGEEYKIRFREKHTRKTYMYGKWERSDLFPNGILSLKLDDLYDKEWKDTKRTPIEKQLAKIMAAFELRAKNDKIRQAKIEKNNREWKKRLEIEKRNKAEREWEEKKGEVLLQQVEKWGQSQKLRSFIDKVESMIENESNEKIKNWIEWAKEEQKELDPLSEGIDILLSKYDFPEDQYVSS